MSHKPEDNDSWKEEKNQRYGKKKRAKTNDSTPPPAFSLLEKMKAALATKFKVEPRNIKSILNNTSLN